MAERFAKGGIGTLIGDGQQTYGSENIPETCYSMGVTPRLTPSVNY